MQLLRSLLVSRTATLRSMTRSRHDGSTSVKKTIPGFTLIDKTNGGRPISPGNGYSLLGSWSSDGLLGSNRSRRCAETLLVLGKSGYRRSGFSERRVEPCRRSTILEVSFSVRQRSVSDRALPTSVETIILKSWPEIGLRHFAEVSSDLRPYRTGFYE